MRNDFAIIGEQFLRELRELSRISGNGDGAASLTVNSESHFHVLISCRAMFGVNAGITLKDFRWSRFIKLDV